MRLRTHSPLRRTADVQPAADLEKATGRGADRTARVVNVLLGCWLFASAFLWPHTAEQFTNTWLVGALTVALAIMGLQARGARWVSVGLAVWLFLSAFILPALSAATIWNNTLVAAGIFFSSLVFSAPPARGWRRRVPV